MSEAHNVAPNMRLAPAESPVNPPINPVSHVFK